MRHMINPTVNLLIESYSGAALWQFGYDENKPLNVVVMQFTGLHDMNGKEIYEGDVVRDGSGDGGTVAYMRTKEARYEAQGIGGDLLVFTETDVEVIGNIYENPELLK